MGFRIQNNVTALNAQTNLGVSDTNLSKALQRLSSGYRINAAKDDAAGLAISQSFRANIASVKVAQRNITEANSLLQVAEGAMSTIGDTLTRMKELATQAASANVGQDISKVSDEYNTLVTEIDRIVNSTKYAGVKLIDGSFSSKPFQIGYEKDANSQLSVNLGDAKAATLGVASGDLATATGAYDSLLKIDTAISKLSSARATVGAYQNRLTYGGANLAATLENFTNAESVIRDVDMASEMTTFTKNQILVQAGVSMLAQANQTPQQVLSLLQ